MARRHRISALVAAGCLALCLAAQANAHLIYVQNSSTSVSDEAIGAALPAFQQQLDLDLSPTWDVTDKLVMAAPPTPTAWRITVTDTPACSSCGGFHHYLFGRAEAFVGTSDDWQLTFSHELLEMAVDPYIHDNGDFAHFSMSGKKLWLVEVGDPVETQSYQRDGVTLSDFALPAWYRAGSPGPWDFMGKTTAPHQVLPGGYAWFVKGGAWVSL